MTWWVVAWLVDMLEAPVEPSMPAEPLMPAEPDMPFDPDPIAEPAPPSAPMPPLAEFGAMSDGLAPADVQSSFRAILETTRDTDVRAQIRRELADPS